jgi:Na+/H+ antiporter NhaC
VASISDTGTVEGALVTGAMGLVPTAILTLLLVTSIGLMEESGLMAAIMQWLERKMAATVRGAEGAIVALITFTNLSVSVNTVAMITAGPLANEIRKKHNVHPHRSANLLDTVSCSFPYLLPYSAITPAVLATQQLVQERYAFVESVSWQQYAPYAIYCLALFPLMIGAVITGFGRKHG